MDPTMGNPTNAVETGSANSQPAQTVSLESGMASMLNSEPSEEPANNTSGDNSTGNEGSTQTTDNAESKPAWTSQLAKEISGNAETMKRLTKFNSITDLAKSYAELEGKLGNSLVKPGKDASAEEVNAFYEKLGKPKSADGYSVDLNGDNTLKELAFANNLTDDQLKGMYEGFKQIGEKHMEAIKAQQQQLLKQTDEALHKEYGPKYGEKIELMKRGIQTYGGAELGQALNNAGVLYHPAIVKLFMTLGEQSLENGTQSKSYGGGNDNYKSNSEGGRFTSKY